MSYFDNDVIKKLREILGEETVIVYNAFEIKTKKAFKILMHYFSSLIDKSTKPINVYQGASRIVKIFPKQRVVNVFLNHGWGTKRSPGIKEMTNEKARRYWRMLRKHTDYVICYSDFDSTYFMRHEALDDLPLPKFVPLGHPRNDFLVKNAGNKSLVFQERKKLGIPEDAKVALFAPTHRESRLLNSSYDSDLLKSFISELKDMDRYLHSLNYFVLFRPHYFTDNVKLGDSEFKNVRIVDAGRYRDPRVLMLISDMLITDYSSIYVDYLLLQKPIAFYQPDIEYFQKVRGLVVDPKDPVHMPGPKISRLKEILDLDDTDFEDYDLKISRSFFHKYYDDNSTERLGEFLLELSQRRGMKRCTGTKESMRSF